MRYEAGRGLKHVSFFVDRGERVAVLGRNGSGKSTLAKIIAGLLKPDTGTVETFGTVGIVFQNPESQIIASIVEDDVAFAPENQGLSPEEIQSLVDTALSTTGMSRKRNAPVSALSGGEKQRTAIAGVLAARVDCLVLDEATAMIDPQGRSEIWETVKRLHADGMTVIQITHQIEALDDVDRVVVLSEGAVAWEGTTAEFFDSLETLGFDVPDMTPRALTVVDGNMKFKVDGLSYSFDGVNKVLEGVNAEIFAGQWLSILGRTGAGKSTLVQHLNALYKIQEGRIDFDGDKLPQSGREVYRLRKRVGLVFQNPEDQFFSATVREELEFAPMNAGLSGEELNEAVMYGLDCVGLSVEFLDRNPLKLSGGEQRLTAIASILSARPEVIILDEPLAGLDSFYQRKLLEILSKLRDEGRTVITITHNLNMATRYSDRTLTLTDGKIHAKGTSSGHYVHRNSFVHRLDPRAKLFSLFLIMTAIFPSKTLFGVGIWAMLLIFLVGLSKIPLRSLMKSSRPLMFLVLFTFIFNMLFTGIYPAIFTSLRLIVIMMFALMMPLTTSPLELSDGLCQLLRPLERFDFPVDEISMMVGMSLRFIPMLTEQTDKIRRAQLSRGARLDEGGIFRRVKAFMPILIPLMLMIFRRADEIALAMEARGYKGGKGRTRRKPLTWKMSDTIILLTSAVMAVIFILSGL